MTLTDHLHPQTEAGRKIKAALEAARRGEAPPPPPLPTPPTTFTSSSMPPAQRKPLTQYTLSELQEIEQRIVKWEDDNFIKLSEDKVQDDWNRYHRTLEKVQLEIKRRTEHVVTVTADLIIIDKPKQERKVKNNERSSSQSALPGL